MPLRVSPSVRVNAEPVCRFAPSPNGELHLGHAYSALSNARFAQRSGGTLLLRFEDIDLERCRPVFETAIEDDLAWLGVLWQPPAARQSTRFDHYRAALERLAGDGLVYPCFCSRGDIARAVRHQPDWPRDPDGTPLYPGTCRMLPANERRAHLQDQRRTALRLDMGAARARWPDPIGWQEYREGEDAQSVEADPAVWGDVVLARREVPTSYHLSVVIDDEAQGVTDVVRGEDLLPSTALHRLLQDLLGLRALRYHHHRLILDEDGRKLSKSAGAAPLRALRAAGVSAAAVRDTLGFS